MDGSYRSCSGWRIAVETSPEIHPQQGRAGLRIGGEMRIGCSYNELRFLGKPPHLRLHSGRVIPNRLILQNLCS